MNKAERIGVFGGTFDPIHNAHLDIARTAMAEAHLDRVLFVVSARPPHKLDDTQASPEDRFAMVAAALADEPAMEPSRAEIDRTGPSYTAETLRLLSDSHPGADLFLIIGMDSLVDLPHWRDPNTILRLATLLVAPRPGQWRIPTALDGHYQILSFNETPLSSTEVRTRLQAGETLDGIVPGEVRRYVGKHGVYKKHHPDTQG